MTDSQDICPYTAFTEDVSVTHTETQRILKGEDAVFSHKASGYRLFAVADGHGGVDCSAFIKMQLWEHMKPHLPEVHPTGGDDETYGLLTDIRKAMLTAFLEVDNAWYRLNKHSGTTLTVALLIGRVLTVANVGDSAAYLHDGHRFIEISKDHRLNNNPSERDRLIKAGLQLAPLCGSLLGPATPGENGYGPLRVWPGGLAVSRSIGDADLTPHVFPFPHIRQLLIPMDGARLMLASDGIWDVLGRSKIQRVLIKKSRLKCAHKLGDLVSRVQGGELRDDASVVIVDILSHAEEATDFKYVIKERRRAMRPTALKRLKASLEIRKEQPFDAFLSDEDGALSMPEDILNRRLSLDDVSSNEPADYTVYGSQDLQGILFEALPSM